MKTLGLTLRRYILLEGCMVVFSGAVLTGTTFKTHKDLCEETEHPAESDPGARQHVQHQL